MKEKSLEQVVWEMYTESADEHTSDTFEAALGDLYAHLMEYGEVSVDLLFVPPVIENLYNIDSLDGDIQGQINEIIQARDVDDLKASLEQEWNVPLILSADGETLSLATKARERLAYEK